MKSILSYIHERAEKARQHPFIVWLHDDNVPVEHRLTSWLPNSATMTMGFRDLNEMIFPYPEEEARDDPRKRAINEHAKETLDNDWQQYLHDLGLLRLDRRMPFTETVRFWRPGMDDARRFLYRLCELSEQYPDPCLRLCLMLPFADFKRVLFDQLAELAAPYMKSKALDLRYVSQRVRHKDVRPVFEGVTLDDATRELALQLARYTCDEIDERWRGNLKFMQEYADWPRGAAQPIRGEV